VNRLTSGQRRIASTATLVVFGGALAVATWVSGDHGFAVALGAFYVATAGVAFAIAGGRGDLAAIMRTDGDERQRALDHEATRIAGIAMATLGVVGTIVQLARGNDPGGFVWTCAVGGVAYVVALAVLRRRG
jgi:hypothetical protein